MRCECKYRDATLYQNNNKNSQWIEYDKLQKQFSLLHVIHFYEVITIWNFPPNSIYIYGIWNMKNYMFIAKYNEIFKV